MIRTLLLLDAIQKKGYTQRGLAKEIGISKNGLNNKIHGRNEFTAVEIKMIIDTLQLTDCQVMEIFFSR